MKKLTLAILILTTIGEASAQVPQALNYQAIARNSMGQIVPSQNIGVRFTIQDATGTTIFYQETHNTTTNNFGLFTLAIGKGTAISGAIAPIDWSTGGDKFLKVEIAPQGGTNYTMQGTTQLLSVPYALYAEKTKLTAGNAITINGNTISANYIAGPGINITGNVISATAGNSWLLNGNAATTAANFLGTTDNLPLNLRTNNIQRFSISESTISGTNNVSYISAGQQSNFSTNPLSLAVYGKDIRGITMPFGVNGHTAGMNWTPSGGSNNTMGSLMRLAQWPDATTNYQFYDLGIDQAGDFFILEHSTWATGAITPRKMLTISPQDFVGVNFGWGEHPTANFHTKGTVRFEGINTNNALTRILVTDALGNLSTRDASTLGGGGGNDWALLGNAGTTAANFLGTTDNIALNLRTNNIQRLSITESTISGTNNVSYIRAGQESNFATTPLNISIYGKDIRGVTMPLFVNGHTAGMTWTPTGGSNNTMGSIMRLAQWPDATTNYQFYDQGIDQAGDFFILEHSTWATGAITPRKMLTISPQDNVGINFGWGEHPTANFHTKGTVRFEGINTNNALTRVVVTDANGNVASRDASTFGNGFWTADANGIHNNNTTGHVGIGGNSSNLQTLSIYLMENTVDGRSTTRFISNDTWQTAISLDNITSDKSFSIVTGGTSNTQATYGVGIDNFGIVNGTVAASPNTIPLIITGDDKVGISSSLGGTNNLPRSRLHVRDGDIYINDIGSGVIMKSPNGQCWRMTVSNAGAPVFTAITCP